MKGNNSHRERQSIDKRVIKKIYKSSYLVMPDGTDRCKELWERKYERGKRKTVKDGHLTKAERESERNI